MTSSKRFVISKSVDYIVFQLKARSPAGWYARRYWTGNVQRRIKVLTGHIHGVTITMRSGTFEMEHWQGWWSLVGLWRDRCHRKGE